MRQNQRGGKRLPYKRKRGESVLYAELVGLPGAETLHKPKALMRLFAAGPPRVCPASPVAPAPAPRPAARFPAPAAAHPAKFGPARAPSAPPAPGGPFPRAPPPRPPRGPLCARRGLGAPPRRFCARPGCATRRPPAPRVPGSPGRPPLARPRAPSRLCLLRRPAVRPCARAPPVCRCGCARAPPAPAPRGNQIFANGSQETAAPSRVNFREIADRGYCPKNTKSAPV